MKLIGLTGHMGSGKDTLAQHLVEDHGYTRLAFADCLRDFVYAANPIVDGFYGVRLREVVGRLGWDAAKRGVPAVRTILQDFGVAARNTIGPDVWVRALLARAEQESGDIVITDVRFPNEASMIQHAGGWVVQVFRQGYDGDGHVSERAMAGFVVDAIGENSAGPELLREEAARLNRLTPGWANLRRMS